MGLTIWASLAPGKTEMAADDPMDPSKSDSSSLAIPTSPSPSRPPPGQTSPSVSEQSGRSDARSAVDAQRRADRESAYRVWPADAAGNRVDYAKGATPNPSAPEAVDIYFGLRASGGPPTKEQNDLQAAIEQVLAAVRALYIKGGVPEPSFRLFYVRLFRLAQLGLEVNPMPDIAQASLSQVIDDLINAEGARVKNSHLTKLGTRAATLGGVFLILYAAISLAAPSAVFSSLKIDPVVAQSFLLLWTGCCGGVWLSYAIRTSTLTLRDLVVTDDDRLLPITRLVFAGSLTMILGLLLALGFVDARIGGQSLAAFTHEPTKALLLGLFCGVSEHLLPSMIGRRANDLLSKFQ